LLVGAIIPMTAFAAQLTNIKDTLSNPRPNPASSSHTFEFTVTTGSATFEEIQFQYCILPSGTCTAPAGLTTTAASKGTITGLTTADWSLENDAAGVPILQHTGGGENIASEAVLSLGLDAITNSSITACQSTKSDTDTCYIRITTCNDLGCDVSEDLDTGIVSYTTIEAITVTARVDPTFSFTVAAVAAGTVSNGVTTSVASTYSTLPFSNLTAGTPVYAAHRLNCITNTEEGYTVTMNMVTQMSGVYGGNIDPFAGATVTWSNPIAWTEPTGTTPNTDTGWIGANTTDNDVAGWTGADSAEFGPVNDSSNQVMNSTSSDNGNVSVYVSYAIEVNVYQPADTYTGTLVYNALPTY
jgi:hypothetical protein